MTRILWTYFLLVLWHPVHLTVTNVEYFTKKKYFIVQVRFFRDDLEKAIFLDTHVKPDFTKEDKQNEKLLMAYIKKYFLLKINGQDLRPQYQLMGYRLEDITLWARFKVKYRNPEIKKVDIMNKLMLNLYPDQQNLLIFVYKNSQRGLTFRRKHTEQVLSF